ncbi:hypothetical protein [Chenggangzhangella methanolivorans]|uniref:SMP-30/Gluconolactonase/LRE-like region domain-containing protein n=1 Tax=Chenggangzhangella methanolivorans TaxID=1437009 RepID=A0A9E6R750_9HYPH|nr:hypothetical protein [Chenggangzhangella methanolivorans]QZN99064.1 hypothetical protein K6K41_19720 [Chenggangzhangella methanolivorans]
MTPLRTLTLAAATAVALTVPSLAEDMRVAKPFLDLGSEINTPDGLGMAPDGTLILSVPNFNNDHLLETKAIAKASPPFMAAIGKNDRLTRWYEFKPADLHPKTGRVGPMDNAFGPDGNLYVTDMQVFYGENISRILRIDVRDGKAVGSTVVAEGFGASNGLYWRGDTLFVTDSKMAARGKGREGGPLTSGVYALTLAEMNKGPISIAPYDAKNPDPRLVHAFSSDNHMGFGADGVTGDDQGALYVSVIEEGRIYKLALDGANKATDVKAFAESPEMTSSDGLVFDEKRRVIYSADFLGNAIHAVDMSGKVTTLQKNGDVTGEDGRLDQPAEVIIRGNQLIVVNMDMAWATPGLSVNTKVDGKNNLSMIDLPASR